MINLRTFFDVVFQDTTITDDELRRFSEDHLARLVANNEDGGYVAIITATEAVVTGYFGAISSEDAATALRMSLTRSRDAILQSFKKLVSRREGRVRDAFGTEAAAYLEFFPKGLTEFSNATLKTVETLMSRMIKGGRDHLTELGQGFLDEFTGLKANFVVAQQAQSQKKGEVTSSKSATSTARGAVEMQLMDNLLTLAKQFKGQPDRGLDFFDQSIIRGPAAAPATPTPPTPAGGGTAPA